MMKKFTIFLILSCLFIFIPTASSQPVAVEEPEKSTDYALPMFIISIVQLPISIIVTWWISDWYHKKKNKPDEIWSKNRQEKLESLKHRTGQSYSMFKTEFENLLSKNTIVEQDLVAYNTKNYENLIIALRQNQKNIYDTWEENLKWITAEEILHYTAFFTHMLWFIPYFQQTSFTESDIQKVNQLLNKIKSQSGEFSGISHIVSFTSMISSDDSKKMKGIKDFKSPVTQK